MTLDGEDVRGTGEELHDAVEELHDAVEEFHDAVEEFEDSFYDTTQDTHERDDEESSTTSNVSFDPNLPRFSDSDTDSFDPDIAFDF